MKTKSATPDRPPQRRAASAWLATLLLTALLPGLALARSGPKVDLFWLHPDFARMRVQGIALLPVATYDHSARTEVTVAAAWGQRYQGAGYRWMTASSSAALMRAGGGDSDSLLRAVDRAILDQGRADSLQAPGLCARFHVNALLSLRVDRWEQIAIEADQRGKPSSTVALTAALVDSSGRMLWRGSGAETVEGLEHVPVSSDAGPTRTGEVQLSADVAGTQPPAYAEVLTRLLTRWGDQFPSRPAAAPAAVPTAADTTRPR